MNELVRRHLLGVYMRGGRVAQTALETFHILDAVGFATLVSTYCVTRSAAEVIAFAQNQLVGDMPKPWMPECTPIRGIILPCPGYTNGHSQMAAAMSRLRNDGHIIIPLIIPPKGNVLGFDDMMELNVPLLAQTRRIFNANPVPVIFVGVSYGGLVAIRLGRVMQQTFGMAPHHIVAVQAPVNGTRLAKFGDHPAAREMLPGSEAVAETQRQISELERRTRLKYFCALYDEVVRRRDCRPPSNGRPHERWAETLPHIGHWGAFQNPFALDVIVGYIRHVTKQPLVLARP